MRIWTAFISELIACEDVGDDDHMVTFGEKPSLQHGLFGPKNGDLRVSAEFDNLGRDAPVEFELVAEAFGIRKREDGKRLRPQSGHILCHVTVACEPLNSPGLQFIGHDYGGADDLASFLVKIDFSGIASGAAPFDSLRDAIELR